MERPDAATRLTDSIERKDPRALAGDAPLQELYGLAQELAATAPEAALDPSFRSGLREQLQTAHPGRQRAAAAAILQYTSFDTPVGTLHVAFAGGAVRLTDLGVTDDLFERECGSRLGVQPERTEDCPRTLKRHILQAIEGGRYRGPVDISWLPEFQQRVLQKTLQIRKGEVRSYGWIARQLGAPQAMRAVGTALARNPIPILIPCHRVVRADYHIGEYGCGGPDKKREILAHEGVDVSGLEQLANRGVRFVGSRTTHIFCLPSCYTGRHVKPEYEVPFPTEMAARAAGYRPCKVCQPA